MTLPVTLAVEASQFLGLKEKRNKQAGYSGKKTHKIKWLLPKLAFDLFTIFVNKFYNILKMKKQQHDIKCTENSEKKSHLVLGFFSHNIVLY